MARTTSWMNQIPEIRQRIAASARSHFSSRELQQIFAIQPRSAQMLARLIPSVRVGRSQLIEREQLISFLDQVQNSSDRARFLADQRKAKPAPQVRRKLRSLHLEEWNPDEGMPLNLKITRGPIGGSSQLVIDFKDVEELARTMLALAGLMDDLDEFADHWEPEPPPETPESDRETVAFLAEIRKFAAERSTKSSS